MEKRKRAKLKSGQRSPKRGSARRWFRRGIQLAFCLVFILFIAVLGSIWHLEHRGLPEFAKSRILENLREKGIELEFKSMRWVPSEGILVEEVTLLAPQDPNEPSFSAEAIQVRMSPLQWLFQEINIEETTVRGGQLSMPVESEMANVETFQIDGISTRLKLHSRQWWELDFLKAEMLGLEVSFSGSVTNAFAFSEWSSGAKSTDTPQKFGRLIKQIVEAKERIQFNTPPEIRVHMDLDAKYPEASTALVTIQSDEIQTRFARIQGAALTAEIPAREDDQPLWDVEWRLDWDQAMTLQGTEIKANLNGRAQLITRSGAFKHAHFAGTAEVTQPGMLTMEPLLLTGRVMAPESEEAFWSIESSLTTDQVQWLGDKASSLERSEWKTQFRWVPGRPQQWNAELDIQLSSVNTPWVSTDKTSLELQINPHLGVDSNRDREDWAWWADVAPYAIDLNARSEGISGPNIVASMFETHLQWEAPTLHMHRFQGDLYQGTVDVSGALDIPSREATLTAKSNFDARKIRHLLSENGKRWIDQYSWVEPPSLTAKGKATLPAWTDTEPDWRGGVKPTLAIDGHFEVGEGAFRGVPVDKASSNILFENMLWNLPNLTIHRPEGITRLAYQCDARNQDYMWDIDSVAQPKALKPLLNEGGLKVLDDLEFPDPVKLTGKVWGRWRHLERTGAEATVQTQRMSYRDQSCLSLQVQGTYTNQFFKLYHPVIVREEGEAKAEALGIDAAKRFITVTNAVSHIHPMAIARAIGPATARTLEPYRFAQPPKVSMSGHIPFDDVHSIVADFEVEGGPFSFWRFTVPNIRTQIDWDQKDLVLRDVNAPFYEGQLNGEMRLKLHEEGGAAFELDADLDQVHLGPFMKDVVEETRESEGLMSGRLRITSAETDDWGSWQGYGKVDLVEGRLWDTPLFGVFSRLMNAISPGLGNSRAAFGSADFTITDSLIETRNLEIKERTARLNYKGSVDFDGFLDARVEAKLLRDTPMLGKVFSLALWPVSKLFEYRVTGPLGEPEIKPLYMVPKYLLVPFQSLNSMDDWLLSEDGLLPVQRLWKTDRKSEEVLED